MHLTDTFVESTRGPSLQSLLTCEGLFLSSKKWSQVNNSPSEAGDFWALTNWQGVCGQACLQPAALAGLTGPGLTELKGFLVNGSPPPYGFVSVDPEAE